MVHENKEKHQLWNAVWFNTKFLALTWIHKIVWKTTKKIITGEILRVKESNKKIIIYYTKSNVINALSYKVVKTHLSIFQLSSVFDKECAVNLSTMSPSLWQRANEWVMSSRNSSWWPTYIINTTDKTNFFLQFPPPTKQHIKFL